MGKFKIQGTIVELYPYTQVSEKFGKATIVVETQSEYPQFISVEFGNKAADNLDGFEVGETVSVDCEAKGRKWVSPQGETKYFNTISGWKVSRIAGEDPTVEPHARHNAVKPQPASYKPAPKPTPMHEAIENGDFDDLPF